MKDPTLADLLHRDLSEVEPLTPALMYKERALIKRLTGITLTEPPDKKTYREVEVALALKAQEQVAGVYTEEANEALSFLLTHYARLVAQRAFKTYHRTGTGDIADYFGEGIEEAAIVLRKFKPKLKEDGTFVSPFAMIERYLYFRLAHRSIEASTGQSYGAVQQLLAQDLNPRHDVVTLPDYDPEDGESTNYIDHAYEYKLHYAQLQHFVAKALQKLKPLERYLVKHLFGLEGTPKLSERDLAFITQQQPKVVRAQVKKALQQLSQHLPEAAKILAARL